MATNSLLPWESWIGTYWFYDIRLVNAPLPVNVCPRCVGYTMIANQMAGLLGHPVSVCLRCIDFHIVKWYMNVSSACGQANGRSQTAQRVTMWLSQHFLIDTYFLFLSFSYKGCKTLRCIRNTVRQHKGEQTSFISALNKNRFIWCRFKRTIGSGCRIPPDFSGESQFPGGETGRKRVLL